MTQRIISLLASGTEMVCGLGLADRLVAISHECDYPPEVLHLPRVTGTRIDVNASSKAIDDVVREMSVDQSALYEIDEQQIAELAPDLIITQAQCDVCAVRYEDVVSAINRYPALSNTNIVALNPLTFDDIFRDIRMVAEACEATTAGECCLRELRERVDVVHTRGQQLATRPRVIGIEWLEPIMIAGNWMPEMIELTGGEAILAAAGKHSPYTAWEQIQAADPDVILIMPCGFDLPRTLAELDVLTTLPGWDATPAARNNHIFAVDGNAYFNRSGPRMVDSLEILASFVQGREMSEQIPSGVWQQVI